MCIDLLNDAATPHNERMLHPGVPCHVGRAVDSSVVLTESFFRNVKDGKNKLEALKLARAEIRKAGYDHPFFWTPFILVGEVD